MACCKKTEPLHVCATAADGTRSTLLQHIVYNEGIASIHGYSTVDDPETLIDVSAFTSIVGGACALIAPDVEKTKLCEGLADGTRAEFFRFITTNFDQSTGAPLTPKIINDFELDGVTPYTVVDEDNVGECPCTALTNSGLQTDWADVL